MAHFRRRCQYSFDNLIIARAPADVASDPQFDLFLRRIRIFLKEGVTAHNDSRRAIAALDASTINHLELDGMGSAAARKPFDRDDLFIHCIRNQNQTGNHGSAADHDCAGATFRLVTSLLGSG